MSVLNQLRRNFHYRGDRHTFWSPCLVGDREALEKIQEKAFKMVTWHKGTTYEESCLKLGLAILLASNT
jgi:hypothetical protein